MVWGGEGESSTDIELPTSLLSELVLIATKIIGSFRMLVN